MKKASLPTLLILLLLIGCSQPVDHDENRNEEQLLSTFHSFVDAYRKLDSEKVLTFLAPDDGFLMLQTTQLEGTEVPNYFISSMETTAYFDSISFENIAVDIMTADIGVLRCTFFEKYTLKTGEQFTYNGAALYLFKKFEDGWKILHAAGAVNPPDDNN